MKLMVNGNLQDVDAEPDTPLLWVLREQVGLTGTKYGCGVGACGACTVHLDGVPIRSCSIQMRDVGEHLDHHHRGAVSSDRSHPIQQAWVELDVPQCGYCQSGQIMVAAALLAETPEPTEDDIVAAMSNICRCGTYNRIKAGIKRAVELS
jgi:isoquinoline 1-oxidoreductase subunit alpha